MAVARGVVELVLEHVAAFNAGDVQRVLRGLSDDVVWQTGSDTFVGIDEVEGLLRDAAGLSPVLEITSLLGDRQRVAVEMTERYLHGGLRREAAIAAWFSFEQELITRVKVFQEGSADP